MLPPRFWSETLKSQHASKRCSRRMQKPQWWSELGILILSRAMQELNASRPILVTDFEISTCFKAQQPSNVRASLVVTDLGELIFLRTLQKAKAPYLIPVTERGNSTSW